MDLQSRIGTCGSAYTYALKQAGMGLKRELQPMSIHRFDTAALHPAPLLNTDVRFAQAKHEQLSIDETPCPSGLRRGICWGFVIEATGALCVYGAWHLWTLLR